MLKGHLSKKGQREVTRSLLRTAAESAVGPQKVSQHSCQSLQWDPDTNRARTLRVTRKKASLAKLTED